MRDKNNIMRRLDFKISLVFSQQTRRKLEDDEAMPENLMEITSFAEFHTWPNNQNILIHSSSQKFYQIHTKSSETTERMCSTKTKEVVINKKGVKGIRKWDPIQKKRLKGFYKIMKTDYRTATVQQDQRKII